MDKIKMANGATYDCSHCTATPDTMFLTVCNVTWAQAAQIFGNENNTRRIEYANRIMTGFTELLSLGKEQDGIQVVLGRVTTTERSYHG